MPKKKIIKKHDLDKFYTNPSVAEFCYGRLLSFVKDETLVEPSAGDGSFYKILRSPKIGFDVDTECDGVILGDWFDQSVPLDSVVVGNPPFGNRNDLTKRFIQHSLPYAKCIAFVLPAVFKKETLQTVFPKNWILVDSVDLPRDSFLLNGEDYHVPCVFQIWLNSDKYPEQYKNLRESVKPELVIADFEFTNDKDAADYFVFGAAPHKLILPSEVNENNRGYYLKSNVQNLAKRFKAIDWKKHSHSSVNGGVAWFTKKQIIFSYCLTYYPHLVV